MKKIAFSFTTLLFLLTFTGLKANSLGGSIIKDVNNDTLTVSFKVNGTAACKSNIETVLTSQTGVINASWNSSSKQITVVFKSALIKNSDLYSLLALAGYDTSELRAKKSAYDALASSCQYTRDPETE